ncbi:MAG: RNA 2',3'-cyclic phosphodiesterase [Promethearchaeota archaeon]
MSVEKSTGNTNIPSKIRSFIAIEIPNKKTLENIMEYQAELQKTMGPLKIVDSSLMHITLRFLGDISEEEARRIYGFLERDINQHYFSEKSSYEGQFKSVGNFGKRVYFIKIHNVNDLLQEIFCKIEKFLSSIQSITPENRPFKPHLTIARAKRNKRKENPSRGKEPVNPGQRNYNQLKTEYADKIFGPWTISKVVLKKSVLTPRGPIYSDQNY